MIRPRSSFRTPCAPVDSTGFAPIVEGTDCEYLFISLCICCAALFSVVLSSLLASPIPLGIAHSSQRHGPVQSSLARYDTTRYYAFHALSTIPLLPIYLPAARLRVYPAHAGLFHRTSAFGSPFSFLLSFPFQYAAARRLLCLMPYALPYASLIPPSQPPKNKKSVRTIPTHARTHTHIRTLFAFSLCIFTDIYIYISMIHLRP